MKTNSFLYAWCGRNKVAPAYEVREAGPKHCPRFFYKVTVPGYDYVGAGNSTSKNGAKQNAAKDFLLFLIREGKLSQAEVSCKLPVSSTSKMPKKAKTVSSTSKMPKKAKTVEVLDINFGFDGNWTLDNAKSELNQFYHNSTMLLEYKYSPADPDHNRGFFCELKKYVQPLGRTLYAREHGSNKQMASKSCALSLLRQLYQLKVIKPYSGVTKKKESDKTEDLDINSGILGNWTLDNAKSILHELFQGSKPDPEYRYSKVDGYWTVLCELNLYVEQLGTFLYAGEHGSNKEMASKSCALSVMRQLYQLNLIKPYSEVTKKKESDKVVKERLFLESLTMKKELPSSQKVVNCNETQSPSPFLTQIHRSVKKRALNSPREVTRTAARKFFKKYCHPQSVHTSLKRNVFSRDNSNSASASKCQSPRKQVVFDTECYTPVLRRFPHHEVIKSTDTPISLSLKQSQKSSKLADTTCAEEGNVSPLPTKRLLTYDSPKSAKRPSKSLVRENTKQYVSIGTSPARVLIDLSDSPCAEGGKVADTTCAEEGNVSRLPTKRLLTYDSPKSIIMLTKVLVQENTKQYVSIGTSPTRVVIDLSDSPGAERGKVTDTTCAEEGNVNRLPTKRSLTYDSPKSAKKPSTSLVQEKTKQYVSIGTSPSPVFIDLSESPCAEGGKVTQLPTKRY